jgi:ABC-type Zn uptake system ZnuABC Zn-binding protein ZnuA
MPRLSILGGSRQTALSCLIALSAAAALLAACGGPAGGVVSGSGVSSGMVTVAPADLRPADLRSGRLLKVTATTGLVGEAVGAVGGTEIDLTLLVPTGSDPHDYELSPQDVVSLNDSDVIFMSGLGYEVFLTKLLGGSESHPPVVALSDGIEPLAMTDELASQPAAAGVAKSGEYDPHVWFDPTSVIQWTKNARQALQSLDPSHAQVYQANAAAYIEQVQQLDQWTAGQVSALPSAHRKLVADHEVLGYLARRYGFTVVGAITPETSDVAEPSAKELAALEATLKNEDVRAIFVGVYDNHSLADQVGRDTGIAVVPIYMESLSPPDGPASSYLDFMRYDVGMIVEALK